eukprot:scaffold2943_cov379-Prasinococcus_capsulatus_cf.AAC.3
MGPFQCLSRITVSKPNGTRPAQVREASERVSSDTRCNGNASSVGPRGWRAAAKMWTLRDLPFTQGLWSPGSMRAGRPTGRDAALSEGGTSGKSLTAGAQFVVLGISPAALSDRDVTEHTDCVVMDFDTEIPLHASQRPQSALSSQPGKLSGSGLSPQHQRTQRRQTGAHSLQELVQGVALVGIGVLAGRFLRLPNRKSRPPKEPRRTSFEDDGLPPHKSSKRWNVRTGEQRSSHGLHARREDDLTSPSNVVHRCAFSPTCDWRCMLQNLSVKPSSSRRQPRSSYASRGSFRQRKLESTNRWSTTSPFPGNLGPRLPRFCGRCTLRWNS